MSSLRGVLDDVDFEKRLAKRIGGGGSREVFSTTGCPEIVVKRAIGIPAVNLIEHIVWEAVAEDSTLAAIFGRVHAVSKTGRYIAMEYLSDITKEDHASVPDVPTWLTDLKYSTFGKTLSGDGEKRVIKVRDYGMLRCSELLRATKLEPPEWARVARLKEQQNRMANPPN